MLKNLVTMTSEEIRATLVSLVLNAYFRDGFRDEFIDFKVTFVPEYSTDYLGYYDIRSRSIVINNLAPLPIENWKTVIHETAHHIDFCKRGMSSHDRQFFEEYKKLLWTAMDLGYFYPYEFRMIRQKSGDYRTLMRMVDEYEKMLASSGVYSDWGS